METISFRGLVAVDAVTLVKITENLKQGARGMKDIEGGDVCVGVVGVTKKERIICLRSFFYSLQLQRKLSRKVDSLARV